MAEAGSKRILITGALGMQGGAAVPYLSGYGHRIRILTHDSAEAKFPKEMDVEIFPGDSRNRESVIKALDGVDGVFLITPSGDGPGAEVTNGKAMIDACAEKEIGHIVYSSVCDANKKTGVAYIDGKGEI